MIATRKLLCLSGLADFIEQLLFIGWLRLEVMFEDGGRIVNEFFNFRINKIPDEIFNTPELTPCKVSILTILFI